MTAPVRQSRPRAGEVVHVGQAASVQFGGGRGFAFRVIRFLDWPTYDGWCWLDGYQLNTAGDAVERRSIFVQLTGLRRARPGTCRATVSPARQRPAIPTARR